MNLLSRCFPALVVVLGGLYIAVSMLPPQDASDQMHIYDFSRIPVIDHGRLKPFDTVARNGLMIISSSETFVDEEDHRQPAIRWLLDVMTSHIRSQESRRFRIDNPQLAKLLALRPTPDGRYSYSDLAQVAPKLLELAEELEKWKEKARDPRAQELLALAGELEFYLRFGRYETKHKVFRIDNDQLLALLDLEPRSGLRYAYTEFFRKIPKLIEQARHANEIDEETRDVYNQKTLDLYHHVEFYIGLARLEAPTLEVVPPLGDSHEWLSYRKAARQEEQAGLVSPGAQAIRTLLAAYAANDVKAFNHEMSKYSKLLDKDLPTAVQNADFETFFNHFDPASQCVKLYVAVFLLSCFAWLGWTGPLNRAAFWLAAFALVVHTGLLFSRMYLMSRPLVFVTNLYSSAVFIGWGGVLVSLIIESIYRNGLGNVVGAAIGFLALKLAPVLSGGNDTLEMMQAVLDTNFWLATHVTCVTFGYMATLVAGLLGIIFIIRGVVTSSLDKPAIKTLGQMMYGVVCFATLFSFTGTVLGGIWADQSWGRFWGWDPKENGALLIVLWNALILHARWAGLIQQRGMAVCTVFGNMITFWSWFGTNQLRVGLHSYGFSTTLGQLLLILWGIHGLIIIVGLLPKRLWPSFAAQQKPRPPVSPMPVKVKHDRRSTAVTTRQ